MTEDPVKALDDNWVDSIDMPSGDYVIDSYSLLIKDPVGKPKYIQFAFCIYPENEYVITDTNPHKITRPISLKYQG